MPEMNTVSARGVADEGVLTLAEAASYLRVPESAVLELVSRDEIPGQKIGGEWRFLKQALSDWLRWGPLFHQLGRRLPSPWVLSPPVLEEWFLLLERHFPGKAAQAGQPAERGSKQAVLKHFGATRDEAGVQEMLDDVAAARKAWPVEGEE